MVTIDNRLENGFLKTYLTHMKGENMTIGVMCCNCNDLNKMYGRTKTLMLFLKFEPNVLLELQDVIDLKSDNIPFCNLQLGNK